MDAHIRKVYVPMTETAFFLKDFIPGKITAEVSLRCEISYSPAIPVKALLPVYDHEEERPVPDL